MKILALFLAILYAPAAAAQVDALESGVYHWGERAVEKTDAGERSPLLEASTTALAHLQVHATTLAPREAPHASHAHDDLEELVIVKEGALRVTIGAESKVLGPGSVAVVLPGDEHGFENTGEAPVTYYVFRYRSKAPLDAARAQSAGGSFMVDWNDLVMRETEKGGVRSYFERPTAMFERFEMHVTTLKEGLQSHPPHTHPAEEFILVMRGDAEEQIGDTHHPATASDLIFLASESLHTIANMGSGEAEYFAFQWQ